MVSTLRMIFEVQKGARSNIQIQNLLIKVLQYNKLKNWLACSFCGCLIVLVFPIGVGGLMWI